MLVSEFKEQLEAGKTIDELIQIKQYLPIVEKHLIATKIIDRCIITDDTGLSRIDFFYKYFTTNLSLLVNYTNLEFSEESINDFDYLSEIGLVEKIIGMIPDSEVDFIVGLVEDELDQMIKIDNSLEKILANKLQVLINRIPDQKTIKKIMNDIPKMINKIKPENLEIFKGILNKQGEKIG
jgi:hypothetical protein